MSLVECLLCPHKCRLGDYEKGICRVRINLEGKLSTLVWGRVAALNIDPVEKKPLFHFLPASRALSVATVGCNLSCKFCQNYELSQRNPEDEGSADWDYIPPEKLVELAVKRQVKSIAYTYSEPTIFYEYTRHSSALAGAQGIRNIMVTAGYIEREPLAKLLEVSHAFNTDLKALDDGYYRDICGGTLQPVLDGITQTHQSPVWLELTNLLVPTLNDDPAWIRNLVRWVLANVGADVPLHFSRFFPCYRLENLPPTPASTLDAAWKIAREEGLHYAYVGNIDHEGNHTYCPRCGTLLIRRRVYTILEYRLRLDTGTGKGFCSKCGNEIPGVWI
jgi:pyruvate formate lyase activating enzyme